MTTSLAILVLGIVLAFGRVYNDCRDFLRRWFRPRGITSADRGIPTTRPMPRVVCRQITRSFVSLVDDAMIDA